MVAPAVGTKRGEADLGGVMALARIGKARRAEEEPVLAAVVDHGPAIFAGQRPAVPQVEPGQDRHGIRRSDQPGLCALDRSGPPLRDRHIPCSHL
jgi:hypothetical protein